MGEWAAISLADLCDDVQYGVTASASTDLSNGPLLLRITDIVPPRIDWGAVPACDVPEEKIRKFELRDGDIVVARTGATVGYAKHVRRPPARAVFASYLVRFRVGDGADPAYIGHVVQSAAYKDYVAAHAGGAAQPNANAKVLGRFPVPLPGKPTQRRIAAVLSAFDDLIEINERRIELLEDLARSLYREWFVHFRFPGHEDVELVDSELGSIPEGWEVRALGDVAQLRYGKSLPAKTRRPGGVPVVSSAGIIDTHDHALVEGPGIVVGRKGNVGSVWWVEGDFFPIDTTYYLESDLSLGFLYWQLQDLEFIDSHAAVPGLNRNQAMALRVVVPGQQVVGNFDQVNRALGLAAAGLRATIDSLAATRDLLLPRLVTGRLDISDIDLGVLTPTEVG